MSIKYFKKCFQLPGVPCSFPNHQDQCYFTGWSGNLLQPIPRLHIASRDYRSYQSNSRQSCLLAGHFYTTNIAAQCWRSRGRKIVLKILGKNTFFFWTPCTCLFRKLKRFGDLRFILTLQGSIVCWFCLICIKMGLYCNIINPTNEDHAVGLTEPQREGVRYVKRKVNHRYSTK